MDVARGEFRVRAAGKVVRFPDALPSSHGTQSNEGVTPCANEPLVVKISDTHAQTLEHEGEERGTTVSSLRCCCSHRLSAPGASWLHAAPRPTGRESAPGGPG